MSELILTDNAREVLRRRYLKKDAAGAVTEQPEDMFRRVADAVAAADRIYDPDADVRQVSDRFFDMMTGLRFLPNSPTLMNAGRPLGQLSACFVLPVDDSMESIFESVKQAALIHKSGGGTGFSFSRLRPAGAPVNSTGGVASGPISFMRVFNTATEAVKQGGTRRGANMGILRVDHPDILEFIKCKENGADITNFNISVGVTEEFMCAVERNLSYDLIDPHGNRPVGRLDARTVFGRIVDSAWHNGEPGIVFLDRINRGNVVPGEGEIESTNPCGEQPLLPYESCNLGSLNLAKMAVRGADGRFGIDTNLLGATIYDAVHFLDNVIDINRYPLERIAEQTRKTRKIGLGVMGFADLLLLLGIPYDSDAAVELAGNLMEFIDRIGCEASQKLAELRGSFPLFSESIHKDGPPLRNGTVTTIAPTGTISILANASSGVEPIFAYVFFRSVMDGTRLAEVNPILKERLEQAGIFSDALLETIAREGSIARIREIPEEIRAVFRSAHDIPPEYHIKIQAAFQKYTDNAVSKTVNFSHAATREQVAEAYILAYKLGCKGITIYRDGSRDNQVLNVGAADRDAKAPPAADAPGEKSAGELPENFGRIRPRPRPEVTKGFTERVKTGCGNLYITVNYDKNGICEVFTSTGKAGGCPSQSESTARLVSIALRSGISVDEIYNQLKGIRCPSTVRVQGLSCTSCPDAIAKVVRKVARFHRGQTDGVEPEAKRASSPPEPAEPDAAPLSESAAPESSEAGDAPGDFPEQPRVFPTAQAPSFTPVPAARAPFQFFRGDRPEPDILLAGRPSPFDGSLSGAPQADETFEIPKEPAPAAPTAGCPECGAPLEHEGGCVICRNCGYSKCG